MRLLLVILVFSLLHIGCNQSSQADIIVHNGVVYLVNEKFETTGAFAVKDGKIIATGSSEQIRKQYTAKEMIDAGGQAVYPGFIDAHAHFLGYGQSLFMVDLFGTASWEEAVERVKKFSKEHPEEKWIKGRGWDQNKWPGKSYPTNKALNEAFPETPVILTRIDGHAAIANQKLLNLAQVNANQKITGGVIETKNGKLTGVLIDNAVDLLSAKMTKNTMEDYVKWLSEAQKNCFRVGLTTVADCGLMYNDVETIDGLQKEGKLDMRLYVMLSDDTANYNRYLDKEPYKSDKMFVKGIKVYADGALGSRGACLLQPYADKKGWYGFLLKDKKYFDSIAQVIAGSDYQMCTHAIGDSANREILHTYNRALGGKNDRRWRIEHAQAINPADFTLFRNANIIPSVQPTHATSDMYWAEERLGANRLKGAYAFKNLLQQNGWLPLGTDFPVEDISPFKTFLAAVYRKDAEGFPSSGFQAINALTPQEALKGMTIWAAKACFLEKEVGSIEPGKKADFIMVDKDLLIAGEKGVLNTKVVMTFIGGKRVF